MTVLLPAIAGWDPPLLRGAVGTLDLVTDRLTVWRTRVEAVGRALEAAQCWSGPAATEAARAVLDLSDTVVAGTAGLRGALGEFSRMVGAAAEAQEAAAAALAAGIEAGAAPQVEALTDRALTSAAVVAEAATAAGRALQPVPDRASPIDLIGVPWRAPETEVLLGRPPGEVAGWWASLPAAEQRQLIATRPDVVGDLDGVPAWARDRANRLVLEAALATPGTSGEETARAVAAEIHRQEAAGRRVQLWTLDLADGLAAVAVGDLDTADAVAVLVPGIFTTPEDDLAAQVGNAADVADRAGAAAPGLAVAALAWIGYGTPQGPLSIITRRDARSGGAALVGALDGLAAARSALGGPAPRTTVVAHSYGAVVLDEAAARPGRLAADAVVLLGSPGGAADAAALEAPEVYDAFSPSDPISWAHWFGPNPWAAQFGATELPTDLDTLHSQYFDPGRPTLGAIAHVVAGR
ncbi:alpha/beta hydrolase [Petropleomorpha daqingensis]|uniref:DUF1023 domain-containing protein n=1 Tax=Petropleomorpha daqingensis TaxID=2026353 RepID=A0A853CHM2_9ACTN|nr:alpha/beta hydrolase [Petropleomorpha daqingensis]NYJ06052.1 hypothetical protein [Petropleomorpha daqingensis]